MVRAFMLAVVLFSVTLIRGGSVEAQSVKPITSLNVFDSNGRKLGSVLSVNGNRWPTFGLRIDGTIVILTVSPGGLRGAQTAILYDDVHCTGQAYVPEEFNTQDVLPLTATLPPGNTLWVQTSTTLELFIPQSILRGYGEAVPGACDEGPFSLNPGYKAAPMLDLLTKFTPPFLVK